MQPVIVINVVGLTLGMVGANTPQMTRFAAKGGIRPLQTIWPAVTCPVQSTFVSGLLPRQHGIVANGWYFRDLSEIWLWRQSNRLVSGEPIWEKSRRLNSSFTCANLFWWYNMYSTVDIGVTPRPMYTADGRKIPDCYTKPDSLREKLTSQLGSFPLFKFWGPATNIASSEWITRAALHVRKTRSPTLTLIYLPHLDYVLQRFGPQDPRVDRDLREIDALCGEIMIDAERDGADIVLLSEYGVMPVSRPIHINRMFRGADLIQIREELGFEQLDPGASAAFAVADHQVAHIYVADRSRIGEIKSLIEALPGVERVLDDDTKQLFGLDHERSGELIAIAQADAWFTYYYWLDDDRAPDYARTVDIHRKPGYDPVELFMNPDLRWPKLAVSWRLAKRALRFRALLDVIPLDAELVKGSHGRLIDDPLDGPLFASSRADLLPESLVAAVDVKDLIIRHLFAD